MVWNISLAMLTMQLLPSKMNVICYLNKRLTWASGRSWNMGSTAMLHSTFGQKTQYGLKGWHSRCLYRATETYNMAVPSDVSHAHSYFLFHCPLMLLNLLILIEGSVIFYQMYSLLQSEKWNNTLSMVLILF